MKHNWYSRFLSLVLAMVLLFELIPTSVWATEATEDWEQDAAITQEETQPDAAPVVTGEVEALRSENEKHYRLSDGSFIVVDYGMPVHYAQGDSENPIWMDIDNTLSASAAPMRTGSVPVYAAVNGTETKAFASVFTPDSYLFSSRLGAYEVSMSLLQAATANQLLEAANPEPTESSAEEETQPETEALSDGLPEGEQETTAPTMPVEDSQPQETEATATVEPTEPTTEAATEPLVGLLQQSQAQVINPGGEIPPLSLDDGEGSEISEQVELPKLSSTVLYPDILPGVDLRYDTVGLNIKESIIVNQRQTSYTYCFRLSLADLTPAEQEDGSILLNNAAGDAIYQIPAPYMIDANHQVSYDVSYDLAEVADGYLLTVTAIPSGSTRKDGPSPSPLTRRWLSPLVMIRTISLPILCLRRPLRKNTMEVSSTWAIMAAQVRTITLISISKLCPKFQQIVPLSVQQLACTK